MEVSSPSTGDSHIQGLESLSKGMLALVVILLLIQLAILALLFPLLRKKQTPQGGNGEREIDLEIELHENTPHNPAPRVQELEYGESSRGGHANEYYAGYAQQGGWTVQPLAGASSSQHYTNQQPRPSGGRGQQSYGADYSKGGRENRFNTDVQQSHNSNNQVNYGRRGNRFAHGT